MPFTPRTYVVQTLIKCIRVSSISCVGEHTLTFRSCSTQSTSNYLARRFGVRAAMPGFIGKKLCPSLVIVPQNFAKYRQVSREVREILADYDPDFCPVGLDESYLDLTDYVKRSIGTASLDKNVEPTFKASASKACTCTCTTLDACVCCSSQHGEEIQKQGDTYCGRENNVPLSPFKPSHPTSTASPLHPPPSASTPSPPHLPPSHWALAEAVVEEMRRRVFERTGLTASAGIAPNKMLAKVASDLNKPNGQYTVPATRAAVLEFVHKLPIRKVGNIQSSCIHTCSLLGIVDFFL